MDTDPGFSKTVNTKGLIIGLSIVIVFTVILNSGYLTTSSSPTGEFSGADDVPDDVDDTVDDTSGDDDLVEETPWEDTDECPDDCSLCNEEECYFADGCTWTVGGCWEDEDENNIPDDYEDYVEDVIDELLDDEDTPGFEDVYEEYLDIMENDPNECADIGVCDPQYCDSTYEDCCGHCNSYINDEDTYSYCIEMHCTEDLEPQEEDFDETLTHEMLHVLFPEWPEEAIDAATDMIINDGMTLDQVVEAIEEMYLEPSMEPEDMDDTDDLEDTDTTE